MSARIRLGIVGFDHPHVLRFAPMLAARPDVELAWGKVGLTVWTHKIDGLHEADFVFAAKADRAHEEWAASSTSA